MRKSIFNIIKTRFDLTFDQADEDSIHHLAKKASILKELISGH